MRLLLGGVITLQVVRQNALKLKAIHTTFSPIPHLAPHLFSRSSLPGSPGSGLFSSIHPEELTQFYSRLVQLRLTVSNRTADDSRNLVMLVPFHIVQNKD